MDNREQIAALAQKARTGNQDAFNELYLLTRDRAYFVAFSITKDEQDALDILQDSYLKAWQGIGSLQNPEQFPAWLHQITGNTAKNYVRQRKPQLFQPGAEDETDILGLQAEKDSGYIPDAAMDTEETRRLIMDIVDDLPEDQRLCILMYYYDDVPLQEIAAALEIPYSTAMSRLALGRKKISRGVEELERAGTKLYGAAPIPLLVWMLNHAAAESGRLLPPLVLAAPAAGGAAAGAAATAAVALPKVIAGIAAVLVITGGTAAVKRVVDSRQAADSYLSTAAAAAETAEAFGDEPEVYTFPRFPTFIDDQTYVYIQPSAPDRTAPGRYSAAAASPAANQADLPAGIADPPAETAAPPTTAAAVTTAAASTAKAATTQYSYIYDGTARPADTKPTATTGATTAPATTTAATTTATTATTTTTTTTTATTTTAAATTAIPTTTTTTTTARIAGPGATTTTTTTTAAPQLIIKTEKGVIFEYTDDILPPDAKFHVNEEYGFTTEIVNLVTRKGVAPFLLSCSLGEGEDEVAIHQLPGNITIKLPVPETHWAVIDQLEVEHGLPNDTMPPMGAWPEDNYLVFTTDYI